MRKKLLIVVGTRPEAIKMAPVYHALKESHRFVTETLHSGQHGELIQQAFHAFSWKPEHTQSLSRTSGDLADMYALLLTQLSAAFKELKPDAVIVHGDTATTTAAAMAAFFNRITLVHVEAGLRSFSRNEPWPEEANRKMVSALADIYFAPTLAAKQNLINEDIAERNIYVTGNTAVDALVAMAEKINHHPELGKQLTGRFAFLDKRKKLILVTGHRRENSGQNLRNVFSALQRLALETQCQIVFPSHPSHAWDAGATLRQTPGVYMLPPLEYAEFVYLMQRCDLIISDSGGIQEEAPTFHKKVLVTRNVTERPEGIESGFLELTGCNEQLIVSRAKETLCSTPRLIHAPNPYGDGKAAKRIRDILTRTLLPSAQPLPLREEKVIAFAEPYTAVTAS